MHVFISEVCLPQARERVFPFFADALSLQLITPPWLDFRVLTPAPIEMRPGALIDYQLKLHGIPIRWQTEITVWEPPVRFVDSQRRGPYRRWEHTHTFTERGGETLCGDRVDYAVPGGAIVNWLFVRRDVERIFRFRRETLLRLFPKSNEAG